MRKSKDIGNNIGKESYTKRIYLYIYIEDDKRKTEILKNKVTETEREKKETYLPICNAGYAT